MPEKFKKKELSYLKSREICRMATATNHGVPQVTPVMYTVDRNSIIIATDYGTRKFKNIKSNPRVSIAVDEYEPNRAILIQGDCEVYERGKEYARLLKILFRRFEYYRENPWKEGEAPILKITPRSVRSWGL